MTDKEVLQRFKKDFDQIEPPDIWDKIQEQKKTEPLPVPPAKNKVMHLNHVIAACVALFVVGAGIFVFMQMQRGNGNVTEEPSETSRNLIEQLTMAKSHGDFALSKRDRKSLEELFPNYDEDTCRVYEDDEYIYYFNKKGELIEVLNVESSPDEEDIEKKVKELFQTYFPNENIDDCKIEMEHQLDSNPAWLVTVYYVYESDIYFHRITVGFDNTGKLLRLRLDYKSKNIGNIPIEQAVQTAIDEVKKDKYGFDDFKREDIKIEVYVLGKGENKYYDICLSNIPLSDDAETLPVSIYVDINSDTGEIFHIQGPNVSSEDELSGTVNEEYAGTYIYRRVFDASTLDPDTSFSSEQIENMKKKAENIYMKLQLNADGTASVKGGSDNESVIVEGNTVSGTWTSDGSEVYVKFDGYTTKYIYDNGTLTEAFSDHIYVKQ